MVDTPNHEYNTPSEGTTDWHLPLNENFENLDIDVEVRDLEANRTDYEPKDGAKFEAIDSGAVYFGDGSNWILANRKLNSLVANEIGSKSQAADVVVYEDSSQYTAMSQSGRVTSGSDAGTVIQSAVDSAGVGGVVQIGRGTFNCDSSVTLHETQWLRGAGMFQTTLQATSGISGPVINSQDDNSSGRDERIRVSEVTVDVQNEGHWGINFFIGTQCIIERVNCINAGSRSGDSPGGIGIRNAFETDGFDQWVINCRTENCSNVSIDCGAGGTDPARAIVYGNKCFNPNYDGQFTHGISVENIDNSTVASNTLIENDGNGPRWNPALNINASSNTTVRGNTMENIGAGIYTANGPGIGNIFANNTIRDFTANAIRISTSGAGPVKDNLIIGNTIDGSGNKTSGAILIDGQHADIIGNVIRNISGNGIKVIRDRPKPTNIISNNMKNLGDVQPVRVDDSGTGERMVFSNNHIAPASSEPSISGPAIDLAEANGICIGNNIAYADSNHPTLNCGNGNGGYWMISDNYIERELIFSNGIVSSNIIGGGECSYSGSDVIVRNNIGVGNATLSVNTGSYEFGSARSGKYSGDGTQDRRIQTAMRPEYVVIENESGDKYDVHAQFGEGFQFSAPSGGISLSSDGFVISDGDSVDSINTDGNIYEFYAR